MTTLFAAHVKCAVCQAMSKQIRIGSAYIADRNLDLRSEPAFSTLRHTVHRCPSCGYCATDLSQAPPEAASTVRSAEYQEILKAEGVNPTATRFRCEALVLAASGNDVGAGWALVRAAWAYDDHKATDEAATNRTSAVEVFLRAKARGVAILPESDAGDSILIADLLRRSGAFEGAAAQIASAPQTAEPVEVDCLAFEAVLISAEDVAAHSMEDALRWRKRSDRARARG
jgi:hypothetical protein